MFASLLNRLLAPEQSDLNPSESQLALGALLVRIAKTDGRYDVAEIQRIDKILARRFDLDAVEAARLRARAEELESQAPDTVRFTRAIKDSVPYEDRAPVMEALWDVALADGIRDPEEDALLRMIAPMLGVSDQDSAQARLDVIERHKARKSQAKGG